MERDAELAAGLHQAEQDVAGSPPLLAHGAAGDPALGDAGADVVLGRIGVQRDLGPPRHPPQLVLAPGQAGQQPIRHDMAGAAGEGPLEPRPQRRRAPRTGARRQAFRSA
jgi:hypothetical protein